MRKLFQLMAISLTVALLPNAYAAKSTTPKFGGVAIPNPASSGQIMNNETFKGTVNKLGSETTKNLDQTVQQQIKSNSESPTPPAPPSSTSATSPDSSAPAQPKQPEANPTTEEDTDEFAPVTQPAATNRSSKPAASTTTQQPSQPSSSGQIYNGFGSGQAGQKNSGGSQDGTSGNWNVGY